MLLLLADRLRDDLTLVLASRPFRDALANLALAHREGKHVVLGARPLLDALAGARELGPETRGTFREIKQLYQDVAGVRARVTHLVEIEARDGDIQEEDSGGQRRYRVP